MAPPGISLDFKRSDEYKSWYSAIKGEHPQLPDYLIDIAIATYRSADPKWIKELVRQAKKEERTAAGKARHTTPTPPTSTTVEDAVRVLNPEQLPETPMVKVVDA
ncbi:hypothetical protein CHLRE_16g691755v5 [Chlamydomonas reinhardtii]|uniref:Uncharacterized protein n=1 Tax=Chlamydomonas reinhardtii TaxID=3055 RepID=A0A2K3CSG7_CHLRE|nr:uncharacterized protein CHLRE_16g691755v5 [Chlamydomonas reinhardtii]PNW71247.1 hypothetical protein CHLRE_16g691755v5 [Chlamydomonas reinhardtii]